MRRLARLLLPMLAAATLGTPAWADEQLVAIEARYRPAEELAELLRPLLGPFEVVIPGNGQLIVKASPERIAEIRAVLGEIDKSPHRLLVSVIQGSNLSLDTLNAGLRVQGNSNAGVQVGGHLYQVQGQDTGGATQQVQTLDGETATIQTGELAPVPTVSGYGYGYGYGVGINYQPMTTGFTVKPRLMGNQVLVEVDPWSERPSSQGNAIAVQNAHVQVRAALGEWVEIGGQTQTTSLSQQGFVGHSYSTRKQENRTFLKVEDLDAGQP